MPEVIIELDLKRRSGVLAGAVAALRKLSLDFKSQQLIDHEGTPRLVLTTEGEVADLSEVETAYADARGVSGLADVRIDGVSLIHLPPEPEPEPELEPVSPSEGEPLAADTTDSMQLEPETAPEPEVPAAAIVTVPDSEEELFDPEAFARHMLSGDDSEKKAKPEGGSSDKAETPRPAASNSAESTGGLKPSMVRRRRRRR